MKYKINSLSLTLKKKANNHLSMNSKKSPANKILKYKSRFLLKKILDHPHKNYRNSYDYYLAPSN